MLGRAIYGQKELVGMTTDVMIKTEGNILMIDPARSGVLIMEEKDGSVTTFSAPAVATVVIRNFCKGQLEDEVKNLERSTSELGKEMYFSYYEGKLLPASENPMNPSDIENRLREIDRLKKETFLEVDVDRETFIETINRLNEDEIKKSRTIFTTDSLGALWEKELFYKMDKSEVFNKVPEFTPLLLKFNENGEMVTDKYKIKPYVNSAVEYPIPGVVYKGFIVNSPFDGELRAFVSSKFSHFKIGLHVSEVRFVIDDLQWAAEMGHIPEDLIVRSNKTSRKNMSFYPVSIDTKILTQMSRIFLDLSNANDIKISFTGDPEDPVIFETKGDGVYPDIIVAISVLRPRALISAR